MKFDIHIPYEPVAKGRPRFARKTGHCYTPAKTENYEDKVKMMFRLRRNDFVDMFDRPLKITLNFFIKKPVSCKRDYPSVRPDIDNYAKAILDAMNGVVFKDDGQIITLHISKRYHEAPGTDVTIEY